jgi:hypothetical protein
MGDFGFNSVLTNLISSGQGLEGVYEELQKLKLEFVTGRVTSIVYDENSEKFPDKGEWDGLGVIEFEVVDNQKPKGKTTSTAYPLLASLRNIPLIDELVLCIYLPDDTSNISPSDRRYYYLPPISVWNHPHQNANPNGIQAPTEDASTQKSTSQISAGSTIKSSNDEPELDLNGDSGGTFVEKKNIHPILPFAGDVIMEGRFGNTIRLGNTAKTNSEYKNNWSEAGKDGDPITIIRNGQPDDVSDEGWLPITEDIDNDKASLYLTSTQQIPLTAVNSYEAFKEGPEPTDEYTGNQAILTSGRLVLNSNTESVLISGKKYISLAAEDNIGITTTKDFVVSAGTIRLGDPEADHPVLLGDDFLEQFKNLVDGLIQIAGELQVAQIYPGGAAAPNLPLNGKAASFRASLEAIKNLLNGKKSPLLSKVTNTA